MLNTLQMENESKASYICVEKILEETDHTDKNRDLNQQILSDLGLTDSLSQLETQVIKTRIMMGMMTKQEKNLFEFNRKWLFLISSRSIYDPQDTECQIEASDLPPWCELDHLYIFHEVDQKWTYDLKVSLSQVTDLCVNDVASNAKDKVNLTYFIDDLFKVFDKDRNKSNDFYSFKISTKEHTHVFFTDFVTTLNGWVSALGNVINRQEEEGEPQEQHLTRGATKDKLEIKFSSGKVYESNNVMSKPAELVDFGILKSQNAENERATLVPNRSRSMYTMEPMEPVKAQQKIKSQHEGYVRMKVNTDFINQYTEKYLRIVE